MTAPQRASFGSIRKLPSGFQARYNDEDGTTHTAPQTFSIRKDAAAYLAGIQTDMIRGSWLNPHKGAIPFGEYAVEVVETRAYKLTPRTVAGYRSLLKKHIIPALGTKLVNEIEIRHIDAFHARLAASSTPVVTRNAYMLASGIFRQAVRQSLIAANPCQVEGAAKEAAKPRPTFTPAHYTAVRDEMPEALRLPLDLMLATHLRLGELCGLDRRHLDLKSGTVTVERQVVEAPGGTILAEPKAGSYRTVAILPHVIPNLSGYLAVSPRLPHAPLFAGERGDRLPRGTLQREWTAARERAGVPEMHLHDIRHVGLTLAAQGGATTRELMRRAGHSTVAASLRYQHASDDRDSKIAAAASALLSG